MADIKKSVNLLPEYLRTDKNSKFLASTIDQLIQTPQVERIDGYVGSKLTPNYNPSTDFYLNENSPLRNRYNLDPALVFKNATSGITDVVAYDDLINEVDIQGGKTDNLDKLFRSKFYSYDPLIDWDKLINYTNYYWLPLGPDIVLLNDEDLDVSEIIGATSYTMSNGYQLSNGLRIGFLDNTLQTEYRRKEYIVEGVGSSIQLVDLELLSSYNQTATVFNETFDSTEFDDYPFDGDKKLPLIPDYITINRSSRDLNPWSRYNRWFHKDVIDLSAAINNIPAIYPLSARAKRPIIEFRPNLQLYNFGSVGVENIDLIDTSTKNAFRDVDGTYGYHIDGILLQEGHRVVFNADTDYEVKGRIYQVTFDLTGEVPILRLVPTLDSIPEDLVSVSVNLGTNYYGTSWYFDSSSGSWVYAQQHTSLNQPPLFDLFTKDGVSYTKITEANNFTGNKVFGYDIGTGSDDPILGFPLKYQNNVGGSSYLFKNYFTTDTISLVSNNLSSELPVEVTFLKLNDNLVNVWTESVEHPIPVIEIQTLSESTNTLTLTCLDMPIDTSLSVSAFVNNKKIPTTVTASTAKVEVTATETFAANDTVVLKIITDQVPNSNGYYEAPIGLTNNPLNGSISSLTLGELEDHLMTMVSKVPEYTGNNLRDLTDYAKYGERLVVNENPISFAQIFLGKKEHNLVDSIRQAGDHYNQFKLNLLRTIVGIDSGLSAPDALDLAMSMMNKSKDLKSLYQRSDMLGYGENKTVRTFTVGDIISTEYPVGFEFDLTRLNFQSVIIYLNGTQLIHGADYTFNYTDGSVTILTSLAVDDVITINCYADTVGSYIPPTPTKMGLYPSFEPEIFTDTSYVNGPVTSIRGHDGSTMVAYGDYRDAIILEYEKRVYNNIKVSYNRNLFDIMSAQPGASRVKRYTKEDFNSILINDFSRWAGTYGVDVVTNSTFYETNSLTWNYIGSIDTVDGNDVSGTWKALFTYFYDTITPGVTPWEMLGFAVMPDWWEGEYGSAPYTSTNTTLWNDLANGYIRGENRYDTEYARPDLLSIIPVDTHGNNRRPNTFLVTENSYDNRSSNWKFGDYSPAEATWRNSSHWPFALSAALALLDPCSYCSKLYDVSRTIINIVDQVIYSEDNLYLNPSKLLIDGENNAQVAGYGYYVVEHGRNKDLSYIEKLRQDLDYLNVNLFHKLGGFASKEKLQIVIDSIDPNSTSPGVILPSEDYSLILNVSNPIKTARISGIIIQKSNGKFVVKGYDVGNPYFEILKPVKNLAAGGVKVGGVSEEFTDWMYVAGAGNKGVSSVDLTSASSTTSKYYKQGQLVRYNNKFYRVKIGHTAESTFDPTFYQVLPELPVKGGASAQLPAGFETTITQIPYGTEFSTIQEVYDVIVGYGAFLEREGFIFDEFNSDLNEILNWRFTGKEFLFWTTQNWADGNLITLSPFANYLKYSFPDSVVDNISTGKYEYSLLKADGKPYPIDRFTMAREDAVCSIKTTDPSEGIFFATLNSVQKEHAMVFNNYTMFNDTIYDIETGYRQRRIKLSGFRTKNWNGDLSSPGFVFDNVEISDWQAYKNYLPGSVVRYNGRYYESLVKISADATFDFTKWDQLRSKPTPQLLPNFDYKINQFDDFYSLDIDNFDAGQQQLAQHLTGYTPRTYLNNIFTNPISQYKFYQGFIKDKGTRNALDKLSKATQYTDKGDIEFKEEWAFRVGHYGSYETFSEIEFPLAEGTSLENPYIVKFVDSLPTDANPLINYVTSSSLLISPIDYSAGSTFESYPGTWEDNNLKLTTAGYVRADDVTTTAYNKNSLLDIANNSIIKNGDTIWLGFLENGDWSVYRYTNQLAKITGVFVSAPTTEITFVTDSHHYLQVGDIVSVVRFNHQVDGVYIVTSTPSISQFTVASTLASIENEELLSYGSLYKFESARYSSLNDLAAVTDLLKLNPGDKVWIDNGPNNKWQVYEKLKKYTSVMTTSTPSPLGQEFGESIFASEDSSVLLVSSPGWADPNVFSSGRVKVYNKLNSEWTHQYDYVLNSRQKTYCNGSTSTEFGYSLQYDIAKKLYITGAPEASNVRTTGTEIISTSQSHIKPFINEGLVKITSRIEDFSKEVVELVLVNPKTISNNSRFGHSVYINQVSSTQTTTLLVSAPGTGNTSTFIGTASVYAYNLNTAIHPISGLTTATITSATNFEVKSTSTVVLSAGNQWGYKIAGSTDGTIIAISDPTYHTSTGIVQIFDKNLNWKQTINSPFGTNGKFGHDIAVVKTDDASYIIISAPEYKATNEPYGKIAIYEMLANTSTFTLYQEISNPLPTNDLKFGHSISINKDADIIAISALGKSRSAEQVFDAFTNVGKTTFDGESTTFFETLPDAGAVYLYNKIGNYFIQSDNLNDVEILPGSKYGTDVCVTNNEVFVGAPSSASAGDTDESRFYVFTKDAGLSWKLLREQDDTVNSSVVSRVALIDTFKEEITEYLDVIDPVKGKIAGIAEQELKYKAAFDPAVYSIGMASNIVDTDTSWIDDHVGELWWDLSTAKFTWYEQGDEIFRKNNWGKLFPGASIDVYEWVKSDLLPSEWAAQADTTKGLVNSISGQPKYPDNSAISVKQVFNNVTGSFENVYYFWVKNKVTLPGVKNRRLSSYQVASYIVDPIANGLKFVEIISPDSIAFANVQPSLVGNRITANIAIDKNPAIPKHTEWLLLNEGDPVSVPNTLLEKKLFDSILGHDSLGNDVPSKELTYRNRYGTGIRPQQTFFKDRLAALRNLVSFANSVLIQNRIVGNYSFENLNKKEEIPTLYSYEYDLIVEDNAALNEVFTLNLVQAEIECYAENGKIKSAIITNPGFGYVNPPKVTILAEGETQAEIITDIDSQGRVISATIVTPGSGFADGQLVTLGGNNGVLVRPHSVIVQVNSDYGNRWTKHNFDYELNSWIKVQTQKYNTTLYWKTVDWVSPSYDSFKVLQYTISDLFALGSLTEIEDGEYVKVKNIGDGKYAILEKVSGQGDYVPSYNIVYRELGTIQLLDILWDFAKYSYDNSAIEETLYDQIPDLELNYILLALKNDIFINSLKVNWNLFFFAAVKYALTEQKLLDWAFKTSFINVKNNIGSLSQLSVYKLNNEEYFEQYINEVKPYHTSIRSYTSVYNKLDQADIGTVDFDLPSYYNTLTDALDVVDLTNPLIDSYPWKSWADNYKLFVDAIEVGYTGSGYTQRPVITITPAAGDTTGSGATAEAYIRNGQLYKVVVTNPGANYTKTPIATITGGGNVTDTARVSVITSNENTRKNIIGIKFDRTSVDGELTDLTVTDEFICDGVTNKFTLSWLASPDKKTITPLLNGKLVYSSDYTIEYFQVKESDPVVDVSGYFPKGSFKGETYTDHRYRYFINTDTEGDPIANIRHYARFVFLNTVPGYGQKFKITYNKNINLGNAVDRIGNFYDPTDSMPGNELPLLMSGAEYPGVSIQGLTFDQTPAWDSTGTGFDSAPWGEYVDSYATTKLLSDINLGTRSLKVESLDGIHAGQFVRPVSTTTSIFRSDARVVSTRAQSGNKYVDIRSLDISDTHIIEAIATSTAKYSLVTLKTADSFHGVVNVGDAITINGLASLYGTGILSIAPVNVVATSTTSVITIYIPPPTYTGIQAVAHVVPVRNGFTLTNADIVIDHPGMGYVGDIHSYVYFTSTNLISQGEASVSLDPGFNQTNYVTNVSDRTVKFRTLFTLSSTVTNILPGGATFNLAPEHTSGFSFQNLVAASKLLDTVVESASSASNVVINAYTKYQDIVTASVRISTLPTEILSTSTDSLWYNLTNSTDGSGRAVIYVQHANSASTVTGDISVNLYGYHDLEFYSHNSDYSSLDSAISGSGISTPVSGYEPQDILIDGNNFLNPVDSYAPEECVPGLVRDAVGINVYTAASTSYPIVMTGAFMAGDNTPSSVTINPLPETPLGFMVYSNGVTFDRVADENSFSTSNQYCIVGNEIIVPEQPSVALVGYTLVTMGADSIVDSEYVATSVDVVGSTGTIAISSALSIDEVQSVYVLLNGNQVSETTSTLTTSTGYILAPTSSNSNRAGVTIYGLPSGNYTAEAWFFDKPNPNFNRVHEQTFNVGSTPVSSLTLDLTPGTFEPVSEQVIVEKIVGTTRTRMVPPWASYYKVLAGQVIFAIDPKNSRSGLYTIDNVKVYLNGRELRPGYDFTVNAITEQITLAASIANAGDALAIVALFDYEYIVSGDSIQFGSPVSNAVIKVTSFTDHDNMMIRTERFTGNYQRRFILSYAAINESYVWVTIDNKPLIAGYDFRLLDDDTTIELSEFINIPFGVDIVVTVINPPSFGDVVLGYRVFKDMFNRQHFNRLSKYFSTTLSAPLQYTDDTIYVEDGDELLQPDPSINLTGVILVDGERIEYRFKDGNIISGLRRSTLGTGPALFSDQGTKVVDISARQHIETTYTALIQHIPSSTSTTYTISQTTNTNTFSVSVPVTVGDGIKLTTATLYESVPNAVDQVEVYYGGRLLRKAPMAVHDKSKSYYDSAESVTILPAEFTITTSTQLLTLNIAEEITTGTRITIIKRIGEFWQDTTATSLLTSTGTQAEFLRSRQAELPDVYFYGGDKVLQENSNALTDENGDPLEGY